MDLSGKKRRKRKYQAYLLVRPSVKKVINQQYEAYVRNLEPDEPFEERIKFVNEKAREMLKKETPEMKSTVDRVASGEVAVEELGDLTEEQKRRRRVRKRQK